MLPMPPRSELVRRVPRVLFGLVLFGIGIALTVLADLGLSPWEAFHQGISRQTGIPLGTVGIITGILVLLLWIPLGQRLGIGTLLNVLVIGIVIDLSLWIGPEAIDPAWLQWTFLVLGTLLIAVGSGYYIGAGLGPGPRDGLMTGLGDRGIPIGAARAGVEISVLVLGWLLGGTIGVGTVTFAFGVGPMIQFLLPRMSMEPIYDYELPDDGAGATEGAL